MRRANWYNFFFLPAIAAALIVLFSLSARAADTPSTPPAESEKVHGIVRDALGNPLSNATVSLKTDAGHPIARTSTDQKGRFSLSVTPGTYEAQVSKQDFKSAETIVTIIAGKRTP
ncbi:MAG TPA: carboxypeptidase-like regulatory domain-containing protein, partial [Candidatus Binataceae bacterium]|nr:carboxypeptidase-like regulatory domain-containing protein [Candidatus Binataceae bacterium]